jgi:hypothetical protein
VKAVALFVVFAGYTAICFGVNHIRGGCVSFKDTVWPSSGAITDPCANVGAGAAVAAATASVGSTATKGIGSLFTSTPGKAGSKSTANPNGGGQATGPGNPTTF